jgi:hypothetical protein
MVSLPKSAPSKQVRAHLEDNTPAVLRFPKASTSGLIVRNRSGFCFELESYAERTEPEMVPAGG